MRPTPWKIRGWAGEHDESGALIEDAEGKCIATTYGGMRQASSAQEWTDYRETAEFIAGAPAEIAALLDRLEAVARDRDADVEQLLAEIAEMWEFWRVAVDSGNAAERERDGLRALVEAFVAVEGSGPPKRWPAVDALIDWLKAHPEGDNGERRS